MKKFLKVFLITILCIISALPMNAFATNETSEAEWYDIDLTESEIQHILDLNPQNNENTRATNLITYYNIAIEKSNSTIKLAAKISCITDVVKCGFKKIVVQRRANSSSSWSTYLTFDEIYYDSNIYVTTKAFTPPAGYQYRAVCTFYAKKNILNTQKIEMNSNIVTL